MKLEYIKEKKKVNKKQFDQTINYIDAVDSAIIALNDKHGFDDNDMLYAHWFEGKNDSTHIQFVKIRRNRGSRKLYSLNIYKYKGSSETKTSYEGSTPEELYNNYKNKVVANDRY